MSFGGSVAAMITSIKANKRNCVSTFEKTKHLKKGYHTEVHFENTATPEELKKLREKIQKESKIQSIKKVLLLLIAIAILIYAIGFVEK
jgi:hypothetical protein